MICLLLKLGCFVKIRAPTLICVLGYHLVLLYSNAVWSPGCRLPLVFSNAVSQLIRWFFFGSSCLVQWLSSYYSSLTASGPSYSLSQLNFIGKVSFKLLVLEALTDALLPVRYSPKNLTNGSWPSFWSSFRCLSLHPQSAGK